MNDPTYDKELIKKDPIWYTAWILSEMYNDQAPLGWSKYIGGAKELMKHLDIKCKQDT